MFISFPKDINDRYIADKMELMEAKLQVYILIILIMVIYIFIIMSVVNLLYLVQQGLIEQGSILVVILALGQTTLMTWVLLVSVGETSTPMTLTYLTKVVLMMLTELGEVILYKKEQRIFS